ncbi:MAG: sensor histidine kinase [Acidiferrobacterales bacterium]
METFLLTTSALPPLATSIVLVLVAIIAVIGSRGSRVGMQLAIWTLTLATWLFFASQFYRAATPEQAMQFVRASHIGISFIPVAGLHFALAAADHRFARSPWMIVIWLLSFLFIFLMLTTNLVVKGLATYSWGYYAEYGPVGIGFVAWFSILYLLAALVLFQAYRRASPGTTARKRSRGLLISFCISVLGALDFLPTIGIDYYPLGWLPVLIYCLSALYLLYRYPLTDIKSAYTSEQVINSIGSGLLILDRDHVIRLANPAIGSLISIDPNSLVGKAVEHALPTDNLGLRIHELLLEKNKITSDIPIAESETGRWQVIKATVSEIRGESGIGVGSLCILQDVTESRRNRSDLEALVTRRTNELETMRDRALEASQAKSVFLASMSHELRTPLNAIIGYSEMLSDDFETLSRDVALQDLDRIRASARHLLGLINNILDLSKIEAGKMDVNKEPIDIEVLIQDISGTVKPLMEKNGNKFRIHRENSVRTIETDSMKLKQILLNLLSNAAKFTTEGDVELFISSDAQGHLQFRIKDTGIGISGDEMDRLFSDYHQASASITSTYGGTGLGLAIVQRFVELIGGSIDATSHPEQGSEFVVNIHC